MSDRQGDAVAAAGNKVRPVEGDRPFGPQAELPLKLEHGFDALYGLELIELSDQLARGRVVVRDELKQPAGLVHGGVYAAISEALASFGTASAVMQQGKLAVGLSNQTSFLRPITEGTINAVAIPKHRGRTTWVWEVEITDDATRLCVLTRVTIAVRDAVG
jgi:1,4-dihydroxy-2-naphthoyl-CoA hydrolase